MKTKTKAEYKAKYQRRSELLSSKGPKARGACNAQQEPSQVTPIPKGAVRLVKAKKGVTYLLNQFGRFFAD